jgi:hypothetical protein
MRAGAVIAQESSLNILNNFERRYVHA